MIQPQDDFPEGYNHKDLMKRDKTTDDILEERGSRYGKFKNHAEIQVKLETAVREGLFTSGATLKPYQRVALDMICHKIARIVNGDPMYDDSWVDIAGYAELVVKELQNEDKTV